MISAEDTTLAQHPFRGLLRTLCAIFLVLILTGICWCAWAVIAHRRLQAQINAIAALHQPFWEADFATPKIPDDKNAAILWKAAFAALPAKDTCPSDSATFFDFKDYPPFPLQWQQMEDQSIADNAKLFELAHRAAAANVADWGNGSRFAYGQFPYFNLGRRTACILGDAIVHAYLHGDDELALQRAADLFELGRAEGQVGNVVSRLVSIGMQDLCVAMVYKSDRTPGLGSAFVSAQKPTAPQSPGTPQWATMYEYLGYTMIRPLTTEWSGPVHHARG